jgi:phosphoglycerate dehydrogenase-like enzyme
VNVACGAIIDEQVLYTHVNSHSSCMAGIDAWWTEPLLRGTFRIDYPFLELPNVLGSPYNSAVVSNSLSEATRQAAENIKHFLEGEKVRGIVPREVSLR